MEALELRYIVLGYEYFQLVSFDIQNGFTIHGGIFFLVPVICVGSSLCAIFSLNIPELLKKNTQRYGNSLVFFKSFFQNEG